MSFKLTTKRPDMSADKWVRRRKKIRSEKKSREYKTKIYAKPPEKMFFELIIALNIFKIYYKNENLVENFRKKSEEKHD